MADITGRYRFHMNCEAGPLVIKGTSPQGTLVDSTLNHQAITGDYDFSTNAIAFGHVYGTATGPRGIIYDGYGMLDRNGKVCGLAGKFLAIREIPVDGSYLIRGSWYATRE